MSLRGITEGGQAFSKGLFGDYKGAYHLLGWLVHVAKFAGSNAPSPFVDLLTNAGNFMNVVDAAKNTLSAPFAIASLAHNHDAAACAKVSVTTLKAVEKGSKSVLFAARVGIVALPCVKLLSVFSGAAAVAGGLSASIESVVSISSLVKACGEEQGLKNVEGVSKAEVKRAKITLHVVMIAAHISEVAIAVLPVIFIVISTPASVVAISFFALGTVILVGHGLEHSLQARVKAAYAKIHGAALDDIKKLSEQMSAAQLKLVEEEFEADEEGAEGVFASNDGSVSGSSEIDRRRAAIIKELAESADYAAKNM